MGNSVEKITYNIQKVLHSLRALSLSLTLYLPLLLSARLVVGGLSASS